MLLVWVHEVFRSQLSFVLFKGHGREVPATARVTAVDTALGPVLNVALFGASEHGLGFVLVAE
jgi:hypothetical protein